MDLWIRSQDREKLVLVKGFETQHTNYDNGCQIFAVWENNYQMIGKYKSKERALEVINEIQKKIKATYLMKAKDDLVDPKYYEPAKTYHSIENDIEIVCGDNFFDLVPINADVIVYEMPEV